eukprot:TRINITY_DN28197_c0_g1_i1.p1 TRINITY_DN28197_c0_g1~~TRINITY_DN28197_c0_g1_i1.p1  ORF type:complete len:140 (+),score=18.65 TRINITY_DN28197_c0_g1_i1:2-421(+)
MQEAKQELIQRLASGALLPFPRLTSLVRSTLANVAEVARSDFEELMTLDQYYSQKRPGHHISLPTMPARTSLPIFEDLGGLSLVGLSSHTPCAPIKLRQLSENVHIYLIKLIDATEKQHQERLGVMKAIARALEDHGGS